MRIALLQNFANYQNRAVRHFEELDQYIAATPAGGARIYDRINFKDRDGIATTQIVNLAAADPGIRPDYLVVVEDDSDRILSRWFVTEWYLKRGRQYEASLVRDIISDNWQSVSRAPANIIRGWCSAANDAIFNSEGASLSQVKQSEHLLKDRTGSAWVVGFMKNAETGLPTNITWRKILNAQPEPALLTNILDNDNGFTVPRKYDDVGYKTMYTYSIGINDFYGRFTFTLRGQVDDHPETTPYQRLWTKNPDASPYRIAALTSEYLRDNGFESYISEYYASNPPYHFTDELEDLENTFFVGSNNRIYKLKKRTMSQMQFSRQVNDQTIGYMASALRYANEQYPEMGYIPDNWDPDHDTLTFWASAVQYSRDYVSDLEQSVDISTNRARLNDRPWSMCAMPVSAIDVKSNQGNFTTQNGIAEIFASKFTEQVGDNCIDVQLLPYCPIPDLVDSDGKLDLTHENEGNTYSFVKNSGTKTSVLLWARESSAHVVIPYTYANPLNPLDLKVEQESQLYRLVAPNYSAAWDFSPTKNNGITCFDVDFTYEPNGSYLRVAPRFGGLYGQNFGDCRGLVISTNFSLPKISDAWVNYQLNNSNYQKTFDRQVKSMERARNASLVSAGVNAVAGIGINLAPGISTAIKATSMMYSAADAALWGDTAAEQAAGEAQFWGAVDARSGAFKSIGLGATQSAQAVTSSAIGAYLQTKAIEDETYLHELKLGDIKAMPDVITQIGAFNINNKLFPLLEIYDATASEKASLRSYLERRSFDIGRTATVEDYLNYDADRTWIEAALLEVPDFTGDAHELAFLKSELSQGVYIYG